MRLQPQLHGALVQLCQLFHSTVLTVSTCDVQLIQSLSQLCAYHSRC